MIFRRARLFALLASITFFPVFNAPVEAQSDPWSVDRDKQELGILSEVPTIIRREGDALLITLQDGQERVYEDHDLACAANDSAHCVRHQAYAYDRKRNVLVLLNRYYEDTDYELISLESGNSIIVSGDLQGAPNGRPYWAVVDDGEHGSGDLKIVTLASGGFRILGQVNHPLCRFERWEAEFAFLTICWGTENNRGEFSVTLGKDGQLQVSRTARAVSDEDILGTEP